MFLRPALLLLVLIAHTYVLLSQNTLQIHVNVSGYELKEKKIGSGTKLKSVGSIDNAVIKVLHDGKEEFNNNTGSANILLPLGKLYELHVEAEEYFPTGLLIDTRPGYFPDSVLNFSLSEINFVLLKQENARVENQSKIFGDLNYNFSLKILELSPVDNLQEESSAYLSFQSIQKSIERNKYKISFIEAPNHKTRQIV